MGRWLAVRLVGAVRRDRHRLGGAFLAEELQLGFQTAGPSIKHGVVGEREREKERK